MDSVEDIILQLKFLICYVEVALLERVEGKTHTHTHTNTHSLLEEGLGLMQSKGEFLG